MNQRKYALELIAEVGLGNAKPSLTPLEYNIKLTNVEFDQDIKTTGILFKDVSRYKRHIGKLLYLMNTRPDIAFAIQTLSQFMKQQKMSYWMLL